MAKIIIPNVVGLSREDAEKKLDAAHMRYIAVLSQGPSNQVLATTQSPAAGTAAGEWTIVTVTYPSIFGPLPDPGLQGEVRGTLQGKILMVGVSPKGGAYVDLLTTDAVRVGLVLFGTASGAVLPTDEWARRAAVLSLAQTAMANGHDATVFADKTKIQSIEVSKM
jgi:PASTA domain